MKTAVEWLEDEIDRIIETYDVDMMRYPLEKAYEQAKVMEKEQMIEFACQVAEASAMKYIQGKTTKMIAEELIKQQEQ